MLSLVCKVWRYPPLPAIVPRFSCKRFMLQVALFGCMVVVLFASTLATAAGVAPTDVSRASEGSVAIATEIIFDERSGVSAEELLKRWQSLRTEPRPDSLSEGFVASPVWVRFTVRRADGDPARWWLVFSNALLDRIDAYVQGPGGHVLHLVSGEDVPVSKAAAPTVLPTFPLDLEAGESRVLLRITTRNALATRLWLRDAPAVVRGEHLNSTAAGLLLGSHLAVSVAALGVFWAIRERVWLLFSLFVALNSILLAHSLGLPSWAIFRDFPGLADRVNGALLMIGLSAALDFSFRLARADIDFPRLFRLGARIAWVTSLAAAALILAGIGVGKLLQLQFLLLAAIPVLLFTLFRQWRRRIESAGYYLMGVGGYAAATEVRFLRNLGVLPSAWWTEGLQEVFSIGYLSVLALGISLQSRRALRERNRLGLELDAERSARRAEQDFLAMLSHELRTPIATIEASVRVLRDVDTLGPAEREDRYRKIERAITRVRELFDRQLARDRISGAWQLSHPERVNLVPILESACRRESDADDSARIDFETSLAEAWVEGDPHLLLVAIENLVTNALAYGPRGGLIELKIRKSGSFWRICVRDRGKSLPLQEQQSIFLPYVRGARSTATPGAGLGLFIVRRIAQAHHGEAGVDATEGGGNEFWVDIPASP
jgi:signal transduction histidine kinase